MEECTIVLLLFNESQSLSGCTRDKRNHWSAWAQGRGCKCSALRELFSFAFCSLCYCGEILNLVCPVYNQGLPGVDGREGIPGMPGGKVSPVSTVN